MSRYLTFILVLWLFFKAFDAAGQATVSGTVTDAATGDPLPGVNVLIKNTTQGTVTDIDGNYTLQITGPDDVLAFSFVGYATQEIPVNNQSVIDVALQTDVSQLEEVVVIGYGTVRKSDLTGAVNSIEGDELNTVPSSNPMQALQAKVPGVQITNQSGAPGSQPVVRIRGIGTSGDASPIYVVDGVILNDISFLNAADIESVEVLKDASALAIYGNRGANGAIIVTTKLGEEGQPTQISISTEYSRQVQQNRIDLLSGRQYAEVFNVISPGTFNNLDAVPNTDWQDLIFQTAPIQNYQASVSGASEKNQYYFSLGYFDEKGTIPKSGFERITAKINERFSPKKFLALGLNLTVSPFKVNNTRNDAPFNVYRASPVIAPRDANGNFNEVPGVGNVLADLEFTTDNVTNGLRTVGQVYAEALFLNGFTLRTSLGTELLVEETEVFTPEFFVSSAQQNAVNNFSKNNFRRTSWIWENTLNYDKELGVHRINAVLGYTLQEVRNEALNLVARDIIRTGSSFRYIDPGNVDPSTINNFIPNLQDFFNQISYLGRVNYSYDGRYIGTLTFRRDGSSKFLGDNKYGNFPAVGFGWNIINESYISFPEVITDLKLRGSWGIVGNDKINYLAAYNTVGNNLNAVFGINEEVYFGQSDNSFGNPDLHWEEVEQFDIGLEASFFKSRLTSEFDIYRRDTEGILVGLPLPDYLGNGSGLVFFNAGEVRNQGFEFNVQWQDDINAFSYNIGVNGSTVENEMLRVSGVEGSDVLEGRFANNTVTRTTAGLPIGAFYGYVVEGVFQTAAEVAENPSLSGTQPGDLIFKDVNGDGVISGDDRTFIGSAIPDLIYGIALGASFSGFSLDLLFQGQVGNEIYNLKETIRPAPYNFEQHVYNYWRGEGTSNTEPRPTIGGNNFLPSTRFIQDGSFFRLRTVTLSYGFPEEMLGAANLTSASLYLRGTNVFTITDFTGYSPEVASGNPLLNGIDQGTFPVSSIYSVGLNLTF